MMDKSGKGSSECGTQRIISKILASRRSGRNRKLDPCKGASTCEQAAPENSHEKSLNESTIKMAADASEDLSDIDDAEVASYLNNEKEMLLKKLMWEAMNEDYLKGRQRKSSTRKKKATTAKKTVKSSSKIEVEDKKRLSSKIDYEALEKLFESEVPKRPRLEGVDADHDESRELQQSNAETPSGSRSFEEDHNDFGNESEYNEEIDYDGESYHGLYPENEDEEGEYDFGRNGDYDEY